MSLLERIATPDNVCAVLANTPAYQQQRDRAGALIHEGFAYYDKYQQWRPFIFAVSTGIALFSGYLWTVRGLMRRKRGYRITEANIFYPMTMAASGAVAWFTRPDTLRAKPSPVSSGTRPSPTTGEPEPGFLAWLDTRVEELREEDPTFATTQINRLTRHPAIIDSYAQTPEIARSIIECGRGRQR